MQGSILMLAAHHHRFGGPHLDYVGIGLAAFVSWIGVTGPGEAALIAAGVLAARGRLDLPSTIAAAWLGAVLGGTAGWLIGRHGGQAVMTAPGPARRLRARMLRAGDRFYTRFGALAVYFAPSWMAGINGMRARRFVPINAACGAVWALLFGVGAYVAGPRVGDLLESIGTAGLVGLALAALLATGAGLRARRRRARGREI